MKTNKNTVRQTQQIHAHNSFQALNRAGPMEKSQNWAERNEGGTPIPLSGNG